MHNVLVIGGAGFVASHLVIRLHMVEGVEKVAIYDNLSSGKRENLLHGDVFFHSDVKDTNILNLAMEGIDTVFMLAANPDISRAVTEPDIDFREGTVLVQNVLEAMRKNGVKRIFYMSGSGVYGDQKDVLFDEHYGPQRPISTYGASKLACEALICAYCHMFGFIGRAFRAANIVGGRQTHGVGYDFMRRLKTDPTKLRILGNGMQCKSYIHVDDLVRAILLVESVAESGYDVFNVATDDSMSVTEIAILAAHLSGVKRDELRVEHTNGDRGWKGDVPFVRMRSDKLKALGWTAERNSFSAMRNALSAIKAEIS